MLFYKYVFTLVLVGYVSAFPFGTFKAAKRDVDPALVPPFGWKSGINPDGTGNCDGAVNDSHGKPIEIPCQCPPNSTFFLTQLNKNVAAGFVTTNPTVKITFPSDSSIASQNARLYAAAVTLQNLEGPGVGCPIVSTTFSAQQQAINAEASGSASVASSTSTTSSAASTTSSVGDGGENCAPPVTVTVTVTATSSTAASTSTPATNAQIAALAPPLGWQAGVNPDGTGNCDGAVNGTDGKPILIPCQCPPPQANYIANLTSNIRAGHVVLNPTVLVTFPTDNSIASQNARLYAAAVTLQNLNGIGIGCPISSTTFAAQQQLINAESASL
ncbi:hypothetical protein BJ138DRAFT_1077245 [Hygrophoropsis aurantiaca]|uniref:Uncharacterized protein n=1 Tax=Hygrophoropsis aurantiaca TaxID=72124 RepID=A0ACB8AS06_9AGAM|nr:hypothetical protein BJ138DRAFT_1077245 [Hygrophoropsis aurantiaca]